MFVRGLTVSKHCIKPSEKMFDSVLTKCVCCIIPSDSSGIVVFDRDLTKGMHCIVPTEKRRVNLVFDRGLPDILTVLYPEREGESRVFDRGLIERMHCTKGGQQFRKLFV